MSTDPLQCLRTAFQDAIVAAFGDDWRGTDPVIRPAAKAEHGDFQCNVAMSLGKRIGTPPRDVAQRLIDAVDVDGLVERLGVAGPGFINIRLDPSVLSEAIMTIWALCPILTRPSS